MNSYLLFAASDGFVIIIILFCFLGLVVWIGLAVSKYILKKQKELELAKEHSQEKKQKELQSAQEGYQKALTLLKNEPTNADLRQSALSLGRTYSNLTREHQGVTIYDEVALMNDINAACAAAGALQHVTASNKSTEPILARLKRLDELKDLNLISEDEYQLKRSKIIDEI